MKIAVTTAREKDNELRDKGLIVSKDLGIPYIERRNYSLNKIMLSNKIDYLFIVEKDRILFKSEEGVLFWHKGTSDIKINGINNSKNKAMFNAVSLQAGNSILDCTLGLAGDSIVFASIVGESGKVVGTEINKFIAYLTKRGLEEYENLGATIEVINESYEEFLSKQADNSFDVVYFDPMFKKPNEKSTAINAFREFADHRSLTKKTIEEALRVCKNRVVIKERQGLNDFEKLGIEKYYGSKSHGAIIYGVIEK